MKAVQRKPAMQIINSVPTTDHEYVRPAQQNNTSQSDRPLQFHADFSNWIAAQNSWVEKHGIPGTELRPW